MRIRHGGPLTNVMDGPSVLTQTTTLEKSNRTLMPTDCSRRNHGPDKCGIDPGEIVIGLRGFKYIVRRRVRRLVLLQPRMSIR
jgi:hypothetical protein